MEEKRLQPDESFRIIQEMVDLARHKITETGFHFLWWGTLVFTACIAHYIMLSMGMGPQASWVWAAMPLIGVPVTLVYESQRNKLDRTQTRFDRIYGRLWLGFGITMVVCIFVSASYGSNPIAFILLLIGLATFVSGAIYRFVPLIAGAFIFWTAAVLCTLMDDRGQLLVNAMAIFAGYIVPGLLLRKKYKDA